MSVRIVNDESRRIVEDNGFALAEHAALKKHLVGECGITHFERHQRPFLFRRFAPAMPEELDDGVAGDDAADEFRLCTGGRGDRFELGADEVAFQYNLHSEIFTVEGESVIEVRHLKRDVRQAAQAGHLECEVGGSVRTHQTTITWDAVSDVAVGMAYCLLWRRSGCGWATESYLGPRRSGAGMRDWNVTRLAGALGAEVRGPDLAALDDAAIRKIESLLIEHHVLFFPHQYPSPETHIAFGERFGVLENHPHLKNATDGLPDKIFELLAENGGVADEWHTDLTYLPEPALYSILHMMKVPSVGGDTMWANLAMAYDELSPPIRALCDGLTAIHDGEANEAPECQSVHPVVRLHPVTGRRVLYVNDHFTRRIVELSNPESQLLLSYLTSWVANPRFTVRYRWTAGTVAMWDNRVTQHFVLNDFSEERRIQRVTVMGDRVEAAAPQPWPIYSRAGGVSDTSRHDDVLRKI